jgi:hypothetical protein
MLKTSNYKALLAAFVLTIAMAETCAASVTTGVPPYRSFGGGPDAINLSNLNVHYSIPVFGRAGRGTPFAYSLAFDSSIWTPSTAWVPNTNWGLHRDIAALVGYVKLSSTYRTCNDPYGGTGDVYNWTFTGYVDPAGTSHPFYIHEYINTCLDIFNDTGTAVATDGSGIKVDTLDDTATVVHPSELDTRGHV